MFDLEPISGQYLFLFWETGFITYKLLHVDLASSSYVCSSVHMNMQTYKRLLDYSHIEKT